MPGIEFTFGIGEPCNLDIRAIDPAPFLNMSSTTQHLYANLSIDIKCLNETAGEDVYDQAATLITDLEIKFNVS